MDKHEVARTLDEVGALLELSGANSFRVRAFVNAARHLESLEDDLDRLHQAGQLESIPGIGKGIAQDISELISTGKLQTLENLRSEIPATLLELLKIQGLGPKKVRTLWQSQGITDLAGLEDAARDGRLRELAGFGAKSQEKILAGIDRVKRDSGRRLWPKAFAAALEVAGRLQTLPQVRAIEIAGSLRRRMETVHDVDLIAAVDVADREAVMSAFVSGTGVAQVLARGETKSSVLLAGGLQVDLRAVAADEFASALHHFTGSKEHNTALRSRAKGLGLKMSEWGLFRGDERLPAADETELFALLGLDYIPPELREDQGEIEAAEAHAIGTLIEDRDLRGVMHVHTTASDGRATLREMVLAARERGLEYLGISDHSPTAAYANGLHADRLREQGREIRALQTETGSFTIFHGTESDILEQGALDFDDDVLAELDFVVASVHSHFGLSETLQTERIVTALRHPAVAILGHPTGRLLLERDPYAVDVEFVIAEAARCGVAIELNANPHRLDLDWRFLRRAVSQGATISIGPDAHSVIGLDDTFVGVGVARKGWIRPAHVLNCRSSQDVLSFCKARRRNWAPQKGTRSRFGPEGELLP